MKAYQRAAISAFLTSGGLFAFIMIGISWFFQPSWGTWTSPWMWGSLLFLWVIVVNQFYDQCLALELYKAERRCKNAR